MLGLPTPSQGVFPEQLGALVEIPCWSSGHCRRVRVTGLGVGINKTRRDGTVESHLERDGKAPLASSGIQNGSALTTRALAEARRASRVMRVAPSFSVSATYTAS